MFSILGIGEYHPGGQRAWGEETSIISKVDKDLTELAGSARIGQGLDTLDKWTELDKLGQTSLRSWRKIAWEGLLFRAKRSISEVPFLEPID